jgi:hypothetical protein
MTLMQLGDLVQITDSVRTYSHTVWQDNTNTPPIFSPPILSTHRQHPLRTMEMSKNISTERKELE